MGNVLQRTLQLLLPPCSSRLARRWCPVPPSLQSQTKTITSESAHGARRLGHPTRHFNVGKYRRKQRQQDEVQNASFFDAR